jgi:hypothetical protein
MKRLIILSVILGAAIFLGAARKALVIGNGDYGQSSLSNAVTDAQDIAQALRGVDFEVTF